jgi:tetratricopeptide (TPR) repeat protein
MRRTRGYQYIPTGGGDFNAAKLFNDPLDLEIDLCKSVLQQVPDEIQTLTVLGELYTQRGLYEKGLEVDRKICVLCPTDSTAHYNLACSLALLDYKEEALDTLAQSVELGYSAYKHLKADPDLDNIREHPRFATIAKKLLDLKRAARAKKSQ